MPLPRPPSELVEVSGIVQETPFLEISNAALGFFECAEPVIGNPVKRPN